MHTLLSRIYLAAYLFVYLLIQSFVRMHACRTLSRPNIAFVNVAGCGCSIGSSGREVKYVKR